MRTTLLTVGLVALISASASAQSPQMTFRQPPPLRSLSGPPFPVCDYRIYGLDRNEGRLAAKRTHNYSWLAAGAGAGLVLPLIGPGILSYVAFKGAPKPDSIPTEWNKDCYNEGFRQQSKTQHAVSAFAGGLVGIAVGVFAVEVLHADDAIVFPLVPGKLGKDN